MSRFLGKRILVTGATSGIGRAGALRLSAEGATVIAVGRNSERLRTLGDQMANDGMVIENDASSLNSGVALNEVLTDAEQLDGLWLNAGFARTGPIEDVSPGEFEKVISTNLRGPVLQLAALAQRLRPGASVVVTSSSSAFEGAAMTSLYSAAKGALLSIVRTRASELGPKGIRVNSLVPGPIATEFRDFMQADERAEFEAGLVNSLALRRIGTAEEAAAVAIFLLSEDASYITGSQIAVDGGLVMR